MEALDIRIGPLVFDHADYYAEADAFYLHVGEMAEAEGEETPGGMCCASSEENGFPEWGCGSPMTGHLN